MPLYDRNEGIKLLPDDICDGCEHFFSSCNVWPDLAQDQQASKWNNIHIVKPGDEQGKNYVGCKSFQQYIPPNEREDRDPGFGKKMSAQEANRWQGIPDNTVRRDEQ